MSGLFAISSLLTQEALFTATAQKLGFQAIGDVDSFLFGSYGQALKSIPAPERLRGGLFMIKPVHGASYPVPAAPLAESLRQIRKAHGKTIYSLTLDNNATLTNVHQCTASERKSMTDGGWSHQTAQFVSRQTNSCIVLASGVSATIYLAGDVYLQSVDVIEALPAAESGGFQSLSWEDGLLLFEFSRGDLNDTTRSGIWRLKDEGVLVPKPEELIRGRLGKFLQTRLAGYQSHYEEAHVEHEGRADISLHLVDDRILILEVKWVGCSLTSTRQSANETDIKSALKKNSPQWFTRFDDSGIRSGVRQLVSYYKSGKYTKAYLALMDCTKPARQSEVLSPDPSDLDGYGPENFRVLRAAVDPRTASVRAKKPLSK